MTIFLIILLSVVVLALVGVLIWRLSQKDKAIKTKHGTKLYLSPLSLSLGNVSKDIEQWTDELVNFWNKKQGWQKSEMYQLMGELKIYLFDAQYIERSGYKLNGAAWVFQRKVEISTFHKNTNVCSLNRVKSLFIHEVSHCICELVGHMEPGKMGEEHHKLFTIVKLGA